jgi:hypothetical protein
MYSALETSGRHFSVTRTSGVVDLCAYCCSVSCVERLRLGASTNGGTSLRRRLVYAQDVAWHIGNTEMKKFWNAELSFFLSQGRDLPYTKNNVINSYFIKSYWFYAFETTVYGYILQRLFLLVLKSSYCVGLMEMLNCFSDITSWRLDNRSV